jgi:hypothetical protein
VFENRVLREIFGSKRDEVTEEWRKLHNEELNDRYCSSDVIRAIKSMRMRWAEHVARLGECSGLLLILIYLSTAIGLTPGGSTHLHTNNTQNNTINNKTTRITKK